MYIALVALIVCDIALLAWTATGGLLLDAGSASVNGELMQHWTLGLSSSILTCFVHCFVMFYLIGTGKDVRDAVEDDEELFSRWVPVTRSLKRRAFPAACLAIFLIILAALMGGEVHSRVIRTDAPLLIRAVSAWWVHGLVVALAVVANLWAFVVEVRVAVSNRRMIQEINAALDG